MGWTDERVETLKKLWLDGHSASQIAKQLGQGVTRNAVIGKVHRLGLSGRAAPSKPARPATFRAARPARPAIAAPVQRRPIERPTAAEPTPVQVRDEQPGTATVLTLGAHMCKWPIGDPTENGFTFCGRRASEGSYCVEHARVAYQPQVKRAGKRNDVAELTRSLRRYI
jgi:GcrA cell cycle regulator